ncbi:MAG: GNAT family N-acetyltransferase [Desulfobacterales bacterium]
MSSMDWLKTYCGNKLATAPEAVARIRSGNRVFIGTGCGEPQHLIKALIDDGSHQDISVYQMLSYTLADYMEDDAFLNRFSVKLFFISHAIRQAAFEGKIDYIPAYLSQIPRLFARRVIGIDVALVQVSPPDAHGFCSLGVSVDITRSGLENAGMVIAQVNPRMPRTWGDSFIHVDDIDLLVWQEESLVETNLEGRNVETAERIGHYVSKVVTDGATLQIGFGNLPNHLLQYLSGKNDLGIHTQLITDGMLPLLQSKVVTNKRKTLLPGRVVASLCMGSETLYRYVDNNPIFYFRSSEFVNDPTVIARNDHLISISSALEVDLTGQVSSDSMGHLFYSGIGDQVDFLRGSAMSKGGFSIIAMPSTAKDGAVSRIVPFLGEGAGVATTRADVSFIITEYGVADLRGKSIFQRVIELTQIAHPRFRNWLIEEAKRRRYIFADQLPPSQDDLLFIEKYKRTFTLEDGRAVDFRPLLPSDEQEYRSFFYSLKERTIYLRFFQKLNIFSHEVVQRHWADIDYRSSTSIIGLLRLGDHREIIAIGSYDEGLADMAEVAFVVAEPYQRQGIGTFLLAFLESIARENGYNGFTATVLKENHEMVRLFRNRYPHARDCWSGAGELQLCAEFEAAPSAGMQDARKPEE